MSKRNRKIIQLSVKSVWKELGGSMEGMICERRMFWVWNESDGVMDGESDDEGDEVTCERGESGRDRWGRGWPNASGSWCNFQPSSYKSSFLFNPVCQQTAVQGRPSPNRGVTRPPFKRRQPSPLSSIFSPVFHSRVLFPSPLPFPPTVPFPRVFSLSPSLPVTLPLEVGPSNSGMPS